MTNEKLAGELECLAGEEELRAYESGDFESEESYLEKAKILREAAKRLRN